ncbi:hypothetical protein IC762_04145 [Bradyrhizobium genosp. L]|uniref:hypothetical protein n=1 Tax=Bradyrhizobium genosp. L TaxID=83637 RepID=UPI0018A2C29E|nr:hypothetical protein [Bradyrhizobium genosp. L]QPF85528.1 hypothetical protein IC762_04145 [Bradyrhizobium genosp. L]
MARLAQTSIRFKEYEVGPSEFERLSMEIDAAAARVAREIYGPAVEVDVVVEAGSLLVRITVIGGLLLGTYDAVSKYKDFKEGVDLLVHDAEKYGAAILNEVVKVTGAKKPDSVSKRAMTPGRISRVVEKLEEIRHLEKHAPKRMLQEQLHEVARDVQAIERDLEQQELDQVDQLLGSRGLPPLDRLPKPDYEDRSAIVRDRIEVGRAPPRKRRKKLRHHNRFVVGDKTPQLR